MSKSMMMHSFLASRKPSPIYSLRTHLPSTFSSLYNNSNPITHSGSTFTTPLFQHSIREFAQRRNNQTCHDDEDDKDGGTFQGVDFANAVRSVALSQMETAVKTLEHDLAKSSTGKACLGMADHIFVETNGVKIPVSKMADVSFYDRRLNPHILLITPHGPSTIQELKEAIAASPIGMSPHIAGKQLEVFLRWLTLRAEGGEAVRNLVINSCEHVEQRIRRVRQKAKDTIRNSISKKKKKEKTGFRIAGLSTDDVKRLEKEVDEITKKYVKSVEVICNTKLKEIGS